MNTRGSYMTAKLKRVSEVTPPTNHKRQGLFQSSSWDDDLACMLEDNGRILEEMESEPECCENYHVPSNLLSSLEPKQVVDP